MRLEQRCYCVIVTLDVETLKISLDVNLYKTKIITNAEDDDMIH